MTYLLNTDPFDVRSLASLPALTTAYSVLAETPNAWTVSNTSLIITFVGASNFRYADHYLVAGSVTGWTVSIAGEAAPRINESVDGFTFEGFATTHPIDIVEAAFIPAFYDYAHSGNDYMAGTPGDDFLRAGAGNDTVRGQDGNDVLYAGPGNDTFMGDYASYMSPGAGRDTVVFDFARSDAVFGTSPFPGSWGALDPSYVTGIDSTRQGMTVTSASAQDGTDRMIDVERLVFAGNDAIAFDLYGHAGQVARLAGALFGADAVHDENLMGLGLKLMDAGMSFDALCTLASESLRLYTPGSALDLVWANIVRAPISAEQRAFFLDLIPFDSRGVGPLVQLAAESSLNATRIDLAGLMQSGLDYHYQGPAL